MIRVKKTRRVPAALQTADVTAALHALEAGYDAAPAACRAPRNQLLHVPATLYNIPAIKARLIADQKEKCCYCEGKLLHIGYGDVEHYRPKNGFKQSPTTKLEKPGYYWLAYQWTNLLFTCKRCNGGHKRNYFPLANHPAGRAYCHHDDLGQEQPLLLHPVLDNPADHIRFRRAVAVGKTARGRATITICGLNRKHTLERRRTHLAHMESHDLMADKDITTMSATDLAREIAKCGTAQALVRRILQARAIRDQAALDSAEYAGMVRANFPLLPQR
ncbi:hypothetical protein [Hymenobacter cellulosilyticus]|uniref:TIGR02646 family protein n=1 Tax=Hymenobacter cellulosilyticus TaxID=2932248 RepID=A0A8T9Q322_9BACT|nr:hypothetical protein [Hymenobacter cellulosilyticus]UOQ70258.1 hypothetical protein MUN79_16040 [Hymenobacter cellulosilyticus]